jgi:ABC-type transport system involved in multi-copper enzyme maturation permease subunit
MRYSLALYSYRELVRERFVHILFFGALLLFAFCFPLGSLSFEERTRVLYHFGFASIYFTAVGLSLFLGSSRMTREFERQTSLIVLARPITRKDFYLGKWAGIAILLAVIILGLSVILYGLLNFFLEDKVPLVDLLKAAIGVGLESLILTSLTLMGSLFLRSSICFFFGFGVFLFGNLLPDLEFFANKSKDPGFMAFAKISHYVVPQLYRMNWRSLNLAQNHEPSWREFALVSLHGLAWTALFLVLGVWIFRRKDLV